MARGGGAAAAAQGLWWRTSCTTCVVGAVLVAEGSPGRRACRGYCLTQQEGACVAPAARPMPVSEYTGGPLAR